ncbi:hypothetical protein ACF07T_11815 [Streptomyces sp. NPDC015184]|uniref:hypothetical protein n=1 Tax=Streptomyces sp. NPDC015184 TaxID=3364946 RepID=UPI0036F88EC0
MHRTNLTAATADESWGGLVLELPHPTGPGLRPEVADGNRMVLAQGPDVMFFAEVDDDRCGVEYLRTDRYRSPVAPLRIAEARAIGGQGQPSWTVPIC